MAPAAWVIRQASRSSRVSTSWPVWAATTPRVKAWTSLRVVCLRASAEYAPNAIARTAASARTSSKAQGSFWSNTTATSPRVTSNDPPTNTTGTTACRSSLLTRASVRKIAASTATAPTNCAGSTAAYAGSHAAGELRSGGASARNKVTASPVSVANRARLNANFSGLVRLTSSTRAPPPARAASSASGATKNSPTARTASEPVRPNVCRRNSTWISRPSAATNAPSRPRAGHRSEPGTGTRPRGIHSRTAARSSVARSTHRPPGCGRGPRAMSGSSAASLRDIAPCSSPGVGPPCDAPRRQALCVCGSYAPGSTLAQMRRSVTHSVGIARFPRRPQR